MCGIIGYASTAPTADDISKVQKLFAASKIRGLHAFGFSYLKGDRLVTVKHLHLKPLLHSLELLKKQPPAMLIGHNRYSTSGDYLNPENNQPIALDNLSLVFNGVISMKTKAEYEQQYQRSYVTENDGEIILRHIQDGKCPVQFLKAHRCSFAGLYLLNGQAYALRNAKRPMWFDRTPTAVFIASTADIFQRALGVQAQQVKPLTLFPVLGVSDV